jgi:hypothetical protein
MQANFDKKVSKYHDKYGVGAKNIRPLVFGDDFSVNEQSFDSLNTYVHNVPRMLSTIGYVINKSDIARKEYYHKLR